MASSLPPRQRPWWLVGCLVFLGVVVLVVVVAVAGSLFMKRKQAGPAYAAAPMAQQAQMLESAAARGAPAPPEAASSPSGGSSGTSLAAEAAAPQRKMVYTGEMTLEVDNIDTATSSLEKTVTAVGGYVSAKDREEYQSGQPQCTLTVRFPAVQFTAVCDAARKLGEIRHEKKQSEDVTKEFVDLEARAKVLTQEENTLANMFARQGSLSDVLQVEEHLARVRTEIEQLQGQLRLLRDQVALSTLTVTLYTKHAEAVRKLDKWDLGYHVLRAWRALVSVLRALTYIVLYTAIVAGPFILVGWLIWRLVRARRRRRSAGPGAVA